MRRWRQAGALLWLLGFTWLLAVTQGALAAWRQVVQTAAPATVLVVTLDSKDEVAGTGSGSIVNRQGIILTNFHVVGNTETGQLYHPKGLVVICMVRKADEPVVPLFVGQVIREAADPQLDLAFVRVIGLVEQGKTLPADLSLPTLKLGDSTRLDLAEDVAALGYPGFGFTGFITFTSGQIAGFARDDQGQKVWIKHSALIGSGNSGGPLINERGELIGVNTGGRADQKLPATMFLARPIERLPREWLPLIQGRKQDGRGGIDFPDGNQGTPRPAGVILAGQVVEADTGRGIPGALFVLMQPGWKPSDGYQEDQVFSVAVADAQGNFRTDRPASRGTTYPVIVGAKGYRTIVQELTIGRDWGDEVRFNPIRLQKP